MQSTVQYDWGISYTFPQALLNVAGFCFGDLQRPQWVAAVFVALGIAAAFRHRSRVLLSAFVLFLIASIQYVADVSGPYLLKHLFTGFWYTDPYRIGAMVSLAAVPLSIAGVVSVAEWCTGWLDRRNIETYGKAFVGAIGTVALIALNFAPYVGDDPDQRIETPFGVTTDEIALDYYQNCIFGLDRDERGFVSKVKEVVGDDVVVNMPLDGSRFLYAANDINVLYRTSSAWGSTSALGLTFEEDTVLGEGIDCVGGNSDVQSLLKRVNAKYLLLLDADWPNSGTVYEALYSAEFWTPMQSINESTPGFELVLSEGDMRLYWHDPLNLVRPHC